MAGLVFVTALSYIALQVQVNINPSRYYIPLGIAAVLLFSVSVNLIEVEFRKVWVRSLVSPVMASLVAAMLFLNAVGAYAQVASYDEAPKPRARDILDAIVAAKPDVSVLQISLMTRTAVSLTGSSCRRCDVFVYTGQGFAPDAETYEQFIDVFVSRAAAKERRFHVY